MNFHLLADKAFRRVQTIGLAATFREALACRRAAPGSDEFDAKYRTDTGISTPLWKLKIVSPNARFGVKYQATSEQELVDSVNFLHENPQTLSFIDLGCGKGRTLLVAAGLGFKCVIGVEFALELVEVARGNLAKMGIVNGIVEHADAADYQLPRCDMVVYLYNPFSDVVMRRVVANLEGTHTNRLYVIYKVPACADVLDSSGFLTPLGSPPGRPYIQVWKATPRE
jgi:predicted RNA methylase